MLALIQQEILEAEKEGNCVIVGRELRVRWWGIRDVSTFLYMQRRRPNAIGTARRFQNMQATPTRIWQHLTSGRAAFIKKFYQQDWCARGLYHLLLNSCVGIESMIQSVTGAAGLTPGAKQVRACKMNVASGSAAKPRAGVVQW